MLMTGCRNGHSGKPGFDQAGFTLVEMMVGLLVSSIILAGTLLVVVRVSSAAGETVGASRVTQQARLVMDQVTKELQRAAYVDWFDPWDNCVDGTTPGVLDDINADGSVNILDFYQCSLPAIDLIGDISLWDFPSPGDATSGTPAGCTTNCDCVLYSYDLNQDGMQGIGSGTPGANQNTANNELFGMRWNAGNVELRVGGNVHSCNTGQWAAINDSSVEINGLGFSLVYATALGTGSDSSMFQLSGDGTWNGSFQNTCTPTDTDGSDPTPVAADTFCLLSRSLDVSLQARLNSDANVIVSLNSTVKNKNNYLNVP